MKPNEKRLTCYSKNILRKGMLVLWIGRSTKYLSVKAIGGKRFFRFAERDQSSKKSKKGQGCHK
jgi:hypothetical protein